MKNLTIFAILQLNALFSLNNHPSSDLNILHLDSVDMSEFNSDLLIESLNHYKFVFLTNFNKENLDLNESALATIKSKHPYLYQLSESENKILLSSCELSHIKIDYLNDANYCLELGHETFPHLFIYGYLPHLSNENIDTLKSFYTANNPYISSCFCGDFQTVNLLNMWDLCTKGEVVVKGEADNKGNKAASGEVRIKSDDQRKSAAGSVEVKENKKGEKETRVKVEAKFEF
jgi:hypothetical protein